jgi:hypothetical protein
MLNQADAVAMLIGEDPAELVAEDKGQKMEEPQCLLARPDPMTDSPG